MEIRPMTLCALILILGAIGHTDSLSVGEGEKSGQCPLIDLLEKKLCDSPSKSVCKTDGDCPDLQKCCSDNCGKVCVKPTPLKVSTKLTIKPGSCRSFTWINSGKCSRRIRRCSHDYNCPGRHKCCSTRCGRVCVSPVPPAQGVCPRITWAKGQKCSLNGLRRCSRDSHCPRHLKCCFNGCGRVCLRPVTVKPGSCRSFPWINSGKCPRRIRRCSHDYNCPGRQKCCSTRCGRVCVSPDVFLVPIQPHPVLSLH